MTIKITSFLVKGFFLLNLVLIASFTSTLERMDEKESLGPVPQFLAWDQDGQNKAEEKVEAKADTTSVSSQEQKEKEEEQNKNQAEGQALGGNSEKSGDPTGKKELSPTPTTKPIISLSPTLSPTPGTFPTPQPTNQCLASGGTYASLPNSCGDSCILVQYPGEINCLDVITDSCDCGPTKCWSGTECVENPNVIGNPKPIDPPKPTCGNNICEPGEEYVSECPVCPEGQEICPLMPCFLKVGVCPEDCN